MIPLSFAGSSGLTWSRIPRSRNHELKLGGQVVGTLRRPTFWSSQYVAETQEGSWTFRPNGFFRSGAQILDAASKLTIATFKQAWKGGGRLTFSDGQTFHLRCRGMFRPVWSIIAGDGMPVFELHTRGKRVELSELKPVQESRVALLILFALYRVLQAEEDAAAAATAAVIAATG